MHAAKVGFRALGHLGQCIKYIDVVPKPHSDTNGAERTHIYKIGEQKKYQIGKQSKQQNGA